MGTIDEQALSRTGDDARRPSITIIGTGHVFDLKDRLTYEISIRQPHLVALELDQRRFEALTSKKDEVSKRDAPLTYRLLADFQERLAKGFGTTVGGEMVAAAETAKTIGAAVALIDADAQVVFQRLWKSMGFMERMRLFFSIFAGIFTTRKQVESQVEQLEDDAEGVIEEVGKEFPTVKRVLIDDRNRHMAHALRKLSMEYERIVAVVGDGHVAGLKAELEREGLTADVVRLKQLRRPAGGTVTVSYSVGAKNWEK
ncbi:MAG: TraB/GumN family protein [Euryarchaeota archaeon]|nr:TraB/GumN family protein [Euryarchaeota archaeon]